MRNLDQRVLLEACVENATSKPLQLAQVKFETASNVRSVPIQSSAALARDAQYLTQPHTWLAQYANSLQVCISLIHRMGHAVRRIFCIFMCALQ